MSDALGNKCHCPACGAKFYDMMKSPATCPKCGHVQPVKRASLVSSSPKVASKPKKPVRRVRKADEEFKVLDGMAPLAELEQLDEFDEDVEHLLEVEDHQEDDDVDPNSDDAEDQMFLDELSAEAALVDEVDEDEDESADADVR